MTRAGLALTSSLLAAASGCTHSYIYAGSDPPRTAHGEVIIERVGEAPESFPIERVLVLAKEGGMRLPTSDEVGALQLGEPLAGVDMIRFDVSTSGAIWRDWILPGFGVGAGLMFVTLGGLGLIEPEGANTLTLPFTLLLAFALGVEGALIGGAIGALGEGGTSDMRFPGGVRLDNPYNPLDLRP